jgi:hypothetical protein
LSPSRFGSITRGKVALELSIENPTAAVAGFMGRLHAMKSVVLS